MNVSVGMAWLRWGMFVVRKFFSLLFFPLVFFASFVVGKQYSFFGLQESDFLFVVGVFTFFLFFSLGIISRFEAKVRGVCYVSGFVIELLLFGKVGDNGIFAILSLPLWRGFLYSILGSVVFRFLHFLGASFFRYPSFFLSVPFAVLIYSSFAFLRTPYSYIFFYLAVGFCVLLVQRSFVKLSAHSKNITIPLYWLVVLGGIGVWGLSSIFSLFPEFHLFYHHGNTRVAHALYYFPLSFLVFFLLLTLIVFTKRKEGKRNVYGITSTKDIFGKERDLRIAFAGGGTGGHVRPIESLLKRRKKQNTNSDGNFSQNISLYRFGQKGSFEETVAQALQKEHILLTFIPIYSGKFRREKTVGAFLKNLRDILLFFAGFFQSLWYTFCYKIDVVVCKGGYVALPVVMAGFFLGRKIIVHESDTHPGLTNVLASYVASDVFTGFPNVLPRSMYVGQILSDELLRDYSKSNQSEHVFPGNEREEFFLPTLNAGRQFSNILVTGGSLGAKTLYEALAHVLENSSILHSCQIVLVGGLLQGNLNSLFQKHPNVSIIPFATQAVMGKLYDRADVCLVRAGATTLAEATLFGCMCVIVPIPWTHDQKQNAVRYAQRYGYVVLDQGDKNFTFLLQRALEANASYRKKKQEKAFLYQQISTTKERIWQKIIEQEAISLSS